MKMFLYLNWFMFRVSLVLSITLFIFSGFKWEAFGLILLTMFLSILVSLLFWTKDKE